MIKAIPVNDSNSTFKILRTLPEDKAFYFYLEIDRPLNVRAQNLEEFRERLGDVDIRSIEFHLKRGDFEKWIAMVGDHTLVQNFADLKRKNLDQQTELRKRLVEMTNARINRLAKVGR